MEDHLRNRDRLAKEWQALCAYQAEPSICSIAQSEANLKKNRNPDYVPCEHPNHPAPGISPSHQLSCWSWAWGMGMLRAMAGCSISVPAAPLATHQSLLTCSLDDHVRIKLKAESNPSRSDFINASPIVSDHWGLLPCHPAP